MDARERYRHDAEFRTLVDVIGGWIHRLQYTPFDVREAAMLAAIREMERDPGPALLNLRDWEREMERLVNEHRATRQTARDDAIVREGIGKLKEDPR